MKKIFCFFSVVLILIMATVPCFAYNEIGGSLILQNIGRSGHLDRVSSGGYDDFFRFSFTLTPGVRYAIYAYSHPLSSSNFTNAWYLAGSGISTVYAFTAADQYVDSPFIFTVPDSSTGVFSFNFVIYSAGNFSIDYSFFIFEVDPSDTSSSVQTLMSNYDFSVLNNYSTGQVNLLPSTFTLEPLVDLYSSFLPMFTVFVQNVPFFPFLIFGCVVLSLCLVMFIIHCIFRRCRS